MRFRRTIRPRGRIRLAVLAATAATVALPAAAHASTVDLAPDDTLTLRAAPGERNSVKLSQEAGAVVIEDLAGVESNTPFCGEASSQVVLCGIGFEVDEVRLGDGNDHARVAVSYPVLVDGGAGTDLFTAGLAAGGSRVTFLGGADKDHVSYVNAHSGVRITNDGQRNDGRVGIDADNIGTDVERLVGSHSSDTIIDMRTSSAITGEVVGLKGDDRLRAAPFPASTEIDMFGVRDGADEIVGGSGTTTLDFSRRSGPVTVTLQHGGADDGEAGEGDEIFGGVDMVYGSPAGDTMRALPGSTQPLFFYGGGGDDTIETADGPDVISGDAGADTILARGGNDSVFADDGFGDIVACGFGTADVANLDSRDGHSNCETRL